MLDAPARTLSRRGSRRRALARLDVWDLPLLRERPGEQENLCEGARITGHTLDGGYVREMLVDLALYFWASISGTHSDS